MEIDYNRCSLIRKDILIKLRPKRVMEKSLIYVKESTEESNLQFFDVVKIAPTVEMVSVGDVVLISWLEVTDPFPAIYDGVRGTFGISEEKMVQAIVENNDV